MSSNLIDINIGLKKNELLDYFRNRASELLVDVKQKYADTQFKERAAQVNIDLIAVKDNLIRILDQKARKENWPTEQILKGVLLITYVNDLLMIESRNAVWPYEYMSFARRIGELWEPFCQLCWEYPLKDNLSYFVPPLFKEVKNKLSREIYDFISSLSISDAEKAELNLYYQKVWSLVTSGEVKLELDLHFSDGANKYVVDFKSGFSSNEKGNTNRLLLVAGVYQILKENFKCLIFVRASEEQNNHYLKTLKNSGLWNVYCGAETYTQIHKHTGFDLSSWLAQNVNWEQDFSKKMYDHLVHNNLTQYLQW